MTVLRHHNHLAKHIFKNLTDIQAHTPSVTALSV